MTQFKKAFFLLTTLVGIACSSSSSDPNNGDPNDGDPNKSGNDDDAGVSAQDASGDGDSSATTIAREDFPKVYTSTICDNVEPCCESVGSDYSKESCVTANTPPDFDSTVTYDANAAALCLAALRDAIKTCGATTDTTGYQNCAKVYTGTHAEGQPCSSPTECQPPTKGSVSCVGGSCRQERVVAVGEKCAGASPDGYFDQCGADGYCPAGVEVCTARLVVGANCTASNECTTNHCNVDHQCVDGTPPQGLGGHCDTPGTGGSYCQDGLNCDPLLSTCGLFDANFFHHLCGG